MAISSIRIRLFLLVMVAVLCFTSNASAKFVLVIDAGHGGRDAGAVGKVAKEKNINLNVALSFGRMVENNCPDVKVVYTRKTDVFIPLYERARIANRNNADLFVSIHTNAVPRGRRVMGMETYTLGMHRAADNLDVAKRENSVILIESDYERHYEGFDPNSSESYIIFELMQGKNMSQSVEMARLVQKHACAQTSRRNMGVNQAGFLVLRETSMPGCLIELGFISTPEEERYLNSKAGVDAYARGIYQAFVNYKRQLARGSAVVEKTPEPIQDPVKQTPVVAQPVKQAPVVAQPVKQAPVVAQPVVKSEKEPDSLVEQKSSASMNDTVVKVDMPVKDSIVVDQKPAEVVQQPAAQQTTQPVSVAQPLSVADNRPMFKIQLASMSRRLNVTDKAFKGLQNVECYEEGGLYKYTYGASYDYNEINRIRKEIAAKFPNAFIIAFKGNQKVNVAEAIREFKQNRNK
ncbi:MAG: N-acetylmuramoyl-L-alanine amidase [Prevotella sp.]|nr:N-acetylmuramoyl-L-alanine amidase [Prevotella sp.]